MEFLNDWEELLEKETIKDTKNYNLETLYEHTHSELSLQQSKRDQIITIYLALFSFLIPFSLSLSTVALWMKGLIFLVAGVIGVLFSFINVRYRVYKEVYWLSCQTITLLMNVKENSLNKQTIQRAFFYTLKKKGKAFCISKDDKKVFSKRKFVKKNTYSAETFHHMIQVILASAVLALSAALIFGDIHSLPIWAHLVIGFFVLALSFILLMKNYFGKLSEVYGVLSYESKENPEEDKKARNKLFNSAFAKAWTLHVYYDEK